MLQWSLGRAYPSVSNYLVKTSVNFGINNKIKLNLSICQGIDIRSLISFAQDQNPAEYKNER